MGKSTSTDRIFRWLVAPLIVLAVRVLTRAIRFRMDGTVYYDQALSSGRPVIFAFWHEDLVSIAVSHLRKRPGPVAVMVSRSRDGERLSAIIRHLYLTPVRASSSRGAVQGSLEMHRWLTGQPGGPAIAAIALDGPRGPRRQAKPGVLRLAAMSDAIILPTGFAYSNAVTFGSWDRTRLLKPFSRLAMNVGEPIDPRQWTDTPEAFAGEITRRIDALHDDNAAS